MRPSVTLILILLNWTFCCSQNFTRCKIYQFLKGDSSSRELVSEEVYNSKGQLITQYFKNYKSGLAHDYITNRFFFYSYIDSLLAQRTYVNDDGDSSKTAYQYNSNGKIVKEQYFELKRGNKVWKTTGEVIFTYDNKGNEVLYEKLEDFETKLKTSKVYDDSNRVIEFNVHTDLSGISKLTKNKNPETIYSKEKYEYFDTQYIVSSYYYSFHTKSLNAFPTTKRLYKLNGKKQELEKWVINENGNSILRRKISYDNDGKKVRTDSFDINGKIEITDIYHYE